MAATHSGAGFDATSIPQYARRLIALFKLLDLIEDPAGPGARTSDSRADVLRSALQEAEAHPEQCADPLPTFLAAVEAAERMLVARYPRLNPVGAAAGAPGAASAIREQQEIYAPEAEKVTQLARVLLDELQRQHEGLERMAHGA